MHFADGQRQKNGSCRWRRRRRWCFGASLHSSLLFFNKKLDERIFFAFNGCCCFAFLLHLLHLLSRHLVSHGSCVCLSRSLARCKTFTCSCSLLHCRFFLQRRRPSFSSPFFFFGVLCVLSDFGLIFMLAPMITFLSAAVQCAFSFKWNFRPFWQLNALVVCVCVCVCVCLQISCVTRLCCVVLRVGGLGPRSLIPSLSSIGHRAASIPIPMLYNPSFIEWNEAGKEAGRQSINHHLTGRRIKDVNGDSHWKARRWQAVAVEFYSIPFFILFYFISCRTCDGPFDRFGSDGMWSTVRDESFQLSSNRWK